MAIAEQLATVREKIKKAQAAAGRPEGSVTLIAVSKTMPMEAIMEAYRAGQRIFGENRVQELLLKKQALASDIQWHLIGQLQTNKVKKIVGEAFLIHSVDSVRLLEAIDKEATKKGIVQKVLLEINMAGEATKSGFSPDALLSALPIIDKFGGVSVRGLMTVAPMVDDPEKNRPVFEKMTQLFLDISTKKWDNISMEHLSMGMTGDYEAAILEGATMVRVGTGIFGRRQYVTEEGK